MKRPDEWVKQRNIFFETHQPKKPYYKTREIDYEAGADAMLEELRGKGVFTYGHHAPDIALDDAPDVISGYWVFIQEEAEE